jgi:Saccharopine dehydrogenase NADP binding domain
LSAEGERPYRVLVLGGYGFFGRRLVERLSRRAGLQLIVAGRSGVAAQALIDHLHGGAAAILGSAELDVHAPGFAQALQSLQPDVVVCASGPFQGQSYAVARACIAAGAHWIDLADARAFVSGIGTLNAEAQAAGVCVLSGASSVPALSCAVADALVLTLGLASVDYIDIGISPGNRTERGLSTVQAILSYCGQPLPGGIDSFGWVGHWHHRYAAPVGKRLLSPCDVPDLVLLPPRYPGHPKVRFGAGLELAFLHRCMNGMARLVRWGWVRDWSRHAGLLKRVADGFQRLGTDAGAMHVAVSGETPTGERRTRRWQLLATEGDGPYVPTLAAAALVRKLQGGLAVPAGARPCLGLLTLEDFAAEAHGLHIRMQETSS